jgi:hypothetical protein
MKLQDFRSNDMIITDLAADDQGAALAEIASFLAKKGVVSQFIRGAASLQKKLLAARNAGRMMDIIREEEERIYA